MGKVFVFVNQKGGVGKTTSAINLGSYITLMGKKTLLIDFDPQGNMSSGVGIKIRNPSIYEALIKKVEIEKTIQETAIKNLFIIPASIDLSGATIEFVDAERREFFLFDALRKIRNEYDYILIDCPPSLGLLTLNALAAADTVHIPLQCEYFAVEGLKLLLETIHRVQMGINPKLRVGGVFFTMYDPRTNLAQDVVRQVRAYFEGKNVLLKTIIPRNVKLSEAPSHGKPICTYDGKCLGALSYKKLAEEVLARG